MLRTTVVPDDRTRISDLRRSCYRFLALLTIVAGPLLAPRPARAAPQALPDSTVVDRWTLSNGLRVVTRHIPQGQAVAITVGYSIGNRNDPPGQEGLAQLLAEVAFTAPAGDIPGRSRDELASLRPLGWNTRVNERVTLLTEIASLDQLPGVLRQVATRMRGVTVDEATLASALASIKRDQGQRFFGSLDQSLYYQVREIAAGSTSESLVRLASAKGLESVKARDLQARVQRLFVPANAVLCLAGNLSGPDLHALLEHEFGSIPAGTAAAPVPDRPLKAWTRMIGRADIPAPAGVIGILAPPVTDPQHPSFYLNILLLGAQCGNSWKFSQPRLPSRFQYSILDEPDLVRFYPPLPRGATDPEALSQLLSIQAQTLRSAVVMPETYDLIRKGILWLLGGEMAPEMVARMRTDGGALHTLVTSMATRELWGGEEFWAGYRARIEKFVWGDIDTWEPYIGDSDHQVRLMFAPRK